MLVWKGGVIRGIIWPMIVGPIFIVVLDQYWVMWPTSNHIEVWYNDKWQKEITTKDNILVTTFVAKHDDIFLSIISFASFS